jgi:predicted O-linked N-acetylglucosamine transferase (SPINDLY family)
LGIWQGSMEDLGISSIMEIVSVNALESEKDFRSYLQELGKNHFSLFFDLKELFSAKSIPEYLAQYCNKDGILPIYREPALISLISLAGLLGKLDEIQSYIEELFKISNNPDYLHSAIYNLGYLENYSDDKLNELAKLVYERCFEKQFSKDREKIKLLTQTLMIPNEKIQVGFLIRSITNVETFLASCCEHVDKNKYQFHWFYLGKEISDKHLNLLYNSRSYNQVPEGDSLKIAEEIVKKGIHILIDSRGIVPVNCLEVFSLKPAPIQLSTFGYWASTGLPQMDFINICSEKLLSQDSLNSLQEQTLSLGCNYSYIAKSALLLEIKPTPCLERKYISFGNLGKMIKINTTVLETWAKILQAVPNSHLILSNQALGISDYHKYLLEFFHQRGISQDRINLFEILRTEQYYEFYNQIDISLDSFPFTSSSTTIDCIWMGTPIVTRCTGKKTVENFAKDILTFCKTPELVAVNTEEYIAKAVELANDFSRIDNYKKTLRNKLLESKFLNLKKASNNFEIMLDEAVQKTKNKN